MAGIPGQQIGALGGQPPIGGSPKAIADAGAVGRGCLVNFIGFGFGTALVSLASAEPLPADFAPAEDIVFICRTVSVDYRPLYTAIAGNTTHQTLSWEEVP